MRKQKETIDKTIEGTGDNEDDDIETIGETDDDEDKDIKIVQDDYIETVQETDDNEDDDDEGQMMNGDHSRDLRYDDDDLNDPVNVSFGFKLNESLNKRCFKKCSLLYESQNIVCHL